MSSKLSSEVMQVNKNILESRGIFGMGITNNYFLDLLNLSILALAGIIIVFFFKEDPNNFGNSGPARTTIWGIGLTSVAVFIMIFVSINKKITRAISKNNDDDKNEILSRIIDGLMNDAFPIVITFMLLIYVMYLNFTFYKKINKNLVSETYHSFTFYYLIIFIVQIILIVKYLYDKLYSINTIAALQYIKNTDNTDNIKTKIKNKKLQESASLIKNITYILGTVNFLMIAITHILLEFFSTDG